MKKIFALVVVMGLAFGSYAQRITGVRAGELRGSYVPAAARTTAVGDTVTVRNIPSTDTLTIYTVGADSGYVTGTDYWNDQAFAEEYAFNDDDSSLQVIGVMATFTGNVSASSGRTVTFTVWDQGIPQLITSTDLYNGFPNNVLDSVSVPVTSLGITGGGTATKSFMFPTPTTPLLETFFTGYSLAYNYNTLAGDTLGLATSKNGARPVSSTFTLNLNISAFGDTTLDTIINVRNATMGSDNVWYENYTQNDSLLNDLAIYPIAVTGTGLSVKGVTRNDLTWYGAYPVPASTVTNIRFGLSVPTGVTIQVTDMAGRVQLTNKVDGLQAGEHTVPVNVSMLPAGDYLYLLRTSLGDGIAGKLTVVR
jgi:hypothetical protein